MSIDRCPTSPRRGAKPKSKALLCPLLLDRVTNCTLANVRSWVTQSGPNGHHGHTSPQQGYADETHGAAIGSKSPKSTSYLTRNNSQQQENWSVLHQTGRRCCDGCDHHSARENHTEESLVECQACRVTDTPSSIFENLSNLCS